jgi:hypothetical protein
VFLLVCGSVGKSDSAAYVGGRLGVAARDRVDDRVRGRPLVTTRVSAVRPATRIADLATAPSADS